MATRYSLFLTSRGMPTFIRPTIVHQVRRGRAPYRGAMKWYADSPGRRTFQIVADVFLLCFLAVCVWLGKEVNDGISTLRGPADGLTSAGDSFRDNMSGAAETVGGIPLVGDGLKSPFEALSGSGQRLADVGTSIASTVDTVARTVGIVVAVVPIVVALLVWAFFRIRFVRRATAASRLVGSEGSTGAVRAAGADPPAVAASGAVGSGPGGPVPGWGPGPGSPAGRAGATSCGVSLDGGETSPRVARLA